jgi:hypothetical protein
VLAAKRNSAIFRSPQLLNSVKFPYKLYGYPEHHWLLEEPRRQHPRREPRDGWGRPRRQTPHDRARAVPFALHYIPNVGGQDVLMLNSNGMRHVEGLGRYTGREVLDFRVDEVLDSAGFRAVANEVAP